MLRILCTNKEVLQQVNTKHCFQQLKEKATETVWLHRKSTRYNAKTIARRER